LAAGLAGCSGGKDTKFVDYITPGKVPEEPPIVATRYPERYRIDIANFMRTWLENPGKVKDAYVAPPTLKPVSGTTLYVTCVRYNSRNNANVYFGERTNMVVFLDGKVTQFLPNEPKICGELSYQRYPEIEKLGPP
jgi:hypothetical protein